MSRLEQLIQELCPDGVEYKLLREVTEMQRGTSLTKAKAIEGIYPVISGGKEPAFYCNTYNRDGETITVAGSGAGAGYVQYWNTEIYANDCFTVKGTSVIDTRFVYYYLSSIQEKIYDTKKGGGVPHVHISDIENFKIPVPALEIQKEIVRILDKFTDCVSDLQTKLQNELQVRRLQYEYYRDAILNNVECSEMELGEVCDFIRGPFGGSLKKECFKSKGYAVYEQQHAIYGSLDFRYFVDQSKYDELKRFKVNSGDLIVSCSGTIGKVFIIPPNAPKGIINQALLKLTPSEQVDANYIKYYFENNITAQLNDSARGGAIKNVPSVGELKKLRIYVPTMEKQIEIVEKLDQLSNICNDITFGLPAEIEARQKQYEYYRDKLLDFKEKKA